MPRPDPSSDPLFVWMRRGFLLTGLLCLGLGIGGFWWRDATERHGTRLLGVVDSVIHQRRTRQGGSLGDVHIIRTTLPNGTVRIFRNQFKTRPDVLQVGDTVRVVYRAEFPPIIYLEGSATGPWFALGVGGGLGLVFLILGFWAIPALERIGQR